MITNGLATLLGATSCCSGRSGFVDVELGVWHYDIEVIRAFHVEAVAFLEACNARCRLVSWIAACRYWGRSGRTWVR